MITADYLDVAAPAGLRVRGTVLVFPGRGESSGTYRRLATRLASDAYRVRVVDGVPVQESPDEQLSELAAALCDAVADLGEDLARPLVLVGSDVSAAWLSALVARSDSASSWWPEALVLAAIPGYGEHTVSGDWESELAVRTHCPVHREVLTNDASLSRGSLSTAVSDVLLDEAYGSAVPLPQLLLVGDSDPIADRAALGRLASAVPNSRLSVVRGGHHDILNDLQHRSVAAEIVTFLEVVRGGDPFQPVITVESAA